MSRIQYKNYSIYKEVEKCDQHSRGKKINSYQLQDDVDAGIIK